MTAAQHWAEQLAGWAVPPDILAAAPVSPWGHEVAPFARRAEQALGTDTPTSAAALAAVPVGGAVLDVGCGAGAGAFALAGRVNSAIGVDERADMLVAFAAGADSLGLRHREVEGRWPDITPAVPAADVVICQHVAYNVADLAPFAEALTGAARVRVVLELTAEHPLAWLRPLWRRFHDLDRPVGPVAADAVALLREAGVDPIVRTWSAPPTPGLGDEERVRFARRRLCLSEARDAELRDALADLAVGRTEQNRDLVTVWWPGGG